MANAQWAIEVGGANVPSLPATNCIIQNNIVKSPVYGVQVGGEGSPSTPQVPLYCTVRNNAFTGLGNVILFNTANNTVQGNIFTPPTPNTDICIEIYYSDNDLIQSNDIVNSQWYAIRLRGSHGNTVQSNFGFDDGQPAIQETEGSNGNAYRYNDFWEVAGNLITNGDFEQGNTGFTTEYTYSPGNIGPAQSYDILPNPRPAHSSDTASYGDHSSGQGLMMAINGAETANVLVWGEKMAVTPNTTYQFSAWISSWFGPPVGQLNVLFNGTSIGTITAPSTTALWVQFTANWYSGTATSVAVELRNLSTADIGNDFALDDISLAGPNAQATQTMVSSSLDPSVYGQPVNFTATVASGNAAVATGTVTFQEGNTILASGVPLDSNGHASFQTSTLSAGASPHTITAYYSGSADFEPSSGSISQRVNKAPLIVIAANVSRTYGSSNPNVTPYVFGIQNNDSITASYTTSATPASSVGNYTIVPTLSDGGTGKLANYTPTILNGSLTITPAPLIITPANITRPFDTPNPTLSGTISGIQNGDNITAGYSTTATLTSPVGAYPITASLRDPDRKSPNYQVKINQGTLTIIPSPDPLLVTSTADSGPGSLRNVLANSPAGSTVHFGISGTIVLTSGPLLLSKDVTISGPPTGFLAISGNKVSRVFQIAPAVTVTLSRLTIENGDSPESVGGGIDNEGTLTLANCRILANFASPRGGGVYNGPTGTLTLLQCLFSGNSTPNAGGGIFNEGNLTVDASTFTGNGNTDADGGALFNLGTVTLTASTFSGNGGSGGYGGAVRNDGLMTVQQCTFASNRADLGGALYNVGTLILSSSTLSLNTAVAGGGGIENSGTLIARNTIVAGNISSGTGPDVSGVLTSLGHNLIGNSSGGSGFADSDLLNVNPLLAGLRSNGGLTQTMALLPGSPAVDAGDNTDAPAYDQRGPGYARIVGGQMDIGAFEVQPGLATRLQISAPVEIPAGSPFDVSVTALDAYGHTAIGYRGSVGFNTSDLGAGVALPSPYTFTSNDQGVHTFVGSVVLVTAGAQSLGVSDTGNRALAGDVFILVDPAPSAPPGGGAERPSPNSGTGLWPIENPICDPQRAAVDQVFSRHPQEPMFFLGRSKNLGPTDAPFGWDGNAGG